MGRAYVNGEAVDLSLNGIRIHREADVDAWLFVQTPTRLVALIYGLDGEWYQANPHSVENHFTSWRHHGPNGNWLTWAIEQYAYLADDTPLSAFTRILTFFQRHLGPIGTVLNFYLSVFLFVVGPPLGLLCRAAKHVARAYRESE
ncbi:MAG: hypothetical protein L0228_09565 [Planctomycetes bacterium]|nr:hypothetical protein [Planctomycetota bacterium]